MKPILTLQFGHYSNYIGTHWWNSQELGFKYDPDSPSEINHDVLFREGQTLKNEVTFTPRLLLVDLKGSLKSLPENGELYSLPKDDTETSSIEIQANQPEEKNQFLKDLDSGATQKKIYNLDQEVKVWSDFLYTRFHPRTVNVIKEYQHASESNKFDIYPLGANLWKSEQFSEDFCDKIRNYIEECDTFQGFQILLDSTDGFAGLTSSCLEHLQDEYTSKSILAFPVNTDANSQTPVKLLNLAFCYNSLNEHTSLFSPLSSTTRKFNFLSLDPSLPYHSSALIAATLDTISLTYRLRNSRISLLDICSDFAQNGRKAAAASLNFPFPLKTNDDLIDCLDNWEGPLCQNLTPNCQLSFDNSLQLLALRGIPESRLKRAVQEAGKQRDLPAYKCETLEEMLSYYLACTCFGSRSRVSVCHEQMTVGAPFPRCIDGRIGRTGQLGENGEVERVSALAGLHTGKFVGEMFDVLSGSLEKVKHQRFHQFFGEGVEGDEFRECFDRLLDLRDCYEDNNYLI